MLNSDGVFRRVTVLLAVLMKGVGGREGGVSFIEYSKKNVEGGLERPAVCGTHHA